MLTCQPKIAFCDMRTSGVRDVLIDVAAITDAATTSRAADVFAGRLGPVERVRWCIKSVHASASRRLGNEEIAEISAINHHLWRAG